jgi:hypothetical protein
METTSTAIAELRAELAELQQQVTTVAADLIVERQISAILRKKTAHCRACQDKPEASEGQPPITKLERTFCEQGHRFKMLSPDQMRTLRTW